MSGECKKSVLAILIFLTFTTLALGADWGLVNQQGNISMSGYNITLVPVLNLTSMKSDGTTLTMVLNGSTILFNSTADTTLSNLVYANDFLNFTANAPSGTLIVSAGMLNNSKPYYLLLNNVKSQSTTSNTTGWVSFTYPLTATVAFSIEPDYRAPTLVSDSGASPTSMQQGFSTTISAIFSDDNAVSSASVHVENPDGSATNLSMTCGTGSNVTCTKVFTSTLLLGTYFIRFYYPQDNSSNIGNISSTKFFEVTATGSGAGGSSGSSGGGSAVFYPPTVEALVNKTVEKLKNLTEPLTPAIIEFRNITMDAVMPKSLAVQKCLRSGPLFPNTCSDYLLVVEPQNYWVFFSAFIFPFFLIMSIMIGRQRKRSYITDSFFYGIITTVLVSVFVFGGINMYILNYLLDSSKYGLTFLQIGFYSLIVASIGDYYGYRKKSSKTGEWVLV